MAFVEPAASTHDHAALRLPLLRTAALRWFTGAYFLLLGLSLLVLPLGSLGPWLGAPWLRGAASVVTGLVILWAIVLAPTRPILIGAHVAAALPQLLIAGEYALLGFYTPAATLFLLAAAAIVAALLPAAQPGTAPSPDLLGLVLGTATAAQGLDLLLRPEAAIAIPRGLDIPAPVVGAIFLVGGVAVIAAQLVRGLPRSLVWAAHLWAGAAVLTLWVAQSLLVDPLYWILGAAVVLRGGALLALPWGGLRSVALDPRALQPRLAMALLTTAVAPLVIAIPIVLGAVESRALARATAAQQRAVTGAAAALGELLREQQQFLRYASTVGQLVDQPPAEQQRSLDRALAAYSPLAAARLYGPGGQQRAAGGTPTAFSGADPWARLAARGRGATLAGLSGASGATLMLAEPLVDAQGAPAGVLVAAVDPALVAARLERIVLEPHASLAVVSEDGQVITLGAPATGRIQPPATAWAYAAEGATANGAIITTPEGEPFLVAASDLAATPWRLVALLPQRTLLSDLSPVRQLVFAVLLLTLTASTVLGWVLTGQIVSSLRRLIAGVARIADGAKDVRLPHEGPTELVQLSRAVSTMAAALDARLAEREALVAQLREQNDDLREYEHAREEAIRALSHDLRNPLTALFANAQRLERLLAGREMDKEARLAHTVIELGRRMNTMIQDLADALRVDAGAVPLRRTPVAPATLLGRLDAYREGEQAQRLQVALGPDLPPVLADVGQVERILSNLISNAFKYSPPDTPVLVRAYRAGDEVVLAVSDRGIGLAPDEQARLFQRYYRTEEARRRASGLGLGLYVTRALVEAHGGRIWVESTPQRGSTFAFTLPCAPPAGNSLREQHEDGHR